jgi:trimeric autotransporter adhesin
MLRHPLHAVRRTATLVTALALAFVRCGGGSDAPSGPLGPAPFLRFLLAAVTLRVGATQSVTVVDEAGGSANGRVVFRSADTLVVRVASGGAITAVAPGRTTVSAQAGTLQASMDVTVSSVPVARVLFTVDSVRLFHPSGRASVVAATQDSSGTALLGRPITYTTGDTAIATVSPLGVVQAVAVGRTTVMASAEDRADTAVVVVVPVPVGRVTLSPDTLALSFPGSSSSVTAVIADSAGGVLAGRPVVFRSADTTVATVSVGGIVAPVGVGSTVISATSEGITATSQVQVQAAAVGRVLMTPDTVRLFFPGPTERVAATTEDADGRPLPGRPVTFRVTNSAVATVSADGTVTPAGTGFTQVIAASGVARDTSVVDVRAASVTRVNVSPDSVRLLTPGGSTTLTVAAEDAAGVVLTGRAVTWRSTSLTVATVTSAGRVDAVGPGTAWIVGSVEGRSDSTRVVVALVPIAQVTVTPDSIRLFIPNGARQLTVSAADSIGGAITGRPFTWVSTDTAVARVSTTGAVTARAVGTARVIASAEGKADTTVVVVALVPIATVTVTPDSVRLFVPNGAATFTAAAADSAGGAITGRPFTWTSTDTVVARVSTAGVVSARAVGTTRIIASAGGRADTSVVVVQLVPVNRVLLSPDSIRLFIPNGSRALTLVVQDSANGTITGRTVTYTSTNTTVATVSAAGVVSALAVGSAQVIAAVEGRADTTRVVVAPVPVVSVDVTPTSVSVPLATTATVTATPRDSAGGAITGRTVAWTSLATGVATVSPATGASTVVTPVALGSTTVRATVDGIIGSASVTVTNPPVPFGGTVTLAGGAAVGGGTVQVFNSTGATLLATVPVNGSGQWTASTLVAGTYRVVLQPAVSHSMGPSEAAFRTLTTPGTTTVSFVVQPALWFDDFQSYADSASLHANFGNIPGVVSRSFNPPGQITLDPTGGPGGTRAMRYNFRVNGNSNQDLWTVIDYRGPSTAGPTVDTVWFRFTTRESPGFETGCATCGNFAYKFFLVGIGRSLGYPNTAGGRLGMYLQGPANAQTMGADMNDRNPDGLGYTGHFEPQRHQMGPNTGWTGTWNTWLVQVAFTSATNATMTMYRNGQQIATTLSNRYLTSANDRQLLDIELGSTLNSGPTVAQQRWWREFGMYRTRPSMLPSFPLNP